MFDDRAIDFATAIANSGFSENTSADTVKNSIFGTTRERGWGMSESSKGQKSPETDTESWARFERAVDAAVKSGPKHKPAQKPSHAASGMTLLPKDQWRLEQIPGGFVAAGIYDNSEHRHWIKVAESDLPNDLISVEDLERLIVDPIHMPPV
jgi:hypothetical protein